MQCLGERPISKVGESGMIPSANLEQINNRINMELARSIRKYGTWEDLKYHQMIDAIKGELSEVDDAYAEGNYSGPHGVFIELAQVAACCIKMMNQIIIRQV
jgi:hypothetical protein